MIAEEPLRCPICGDVLEESRAEPEGAMLCRSCSDAGESDEPRPEPGLGQFLRGGLWILGAAVGCLIAATVVVWVVHLLVEVLEEWS